MRRGSCDPGEGTAAGHASLALRSCRSWPAPGHVLCGFSCKRRHPQNCAAAWSTRGSRGDAASALLVRSQVCASRGARPSQSHIDRAAIRSQPSSWAGGLYAMAQRSQPRCKGKRPGRRHWVFLQHGLGAHESGQRLRQSRGWYSAAGHQHSLARHPCPACPDRTPAAGL